MKVELNLAQAMYVAQLLETPVQAHHRILREMARPSTIGPTAEVYVLDTESPMGRVLISRLITEMEDARNISDPEKAASKYDNAWAVMRWYVSSVSLVV